MRSAFRSKVFLTVLTLLGLLIVGIPLTIKGDGTIAGYCRILIDYTLNFVRAILAIATIWAGCASISQEVENKSIQMTMSKPVNALQLWFGKWLGLMTPIFMLVIFSGAIVYGILMWNVRPSQLSDTEQEILRQEILVGRKDEEPREPEGMRERVDAMVKQALAGGSVPSNMSESELRRAARRTFMRHRQTCEPGQSCGWTFTLPARDEAKPITLEYRIASSQIGGVSMSGEWIASNPDGEVLHREKTTVKTESENKHSIPGAVAAKGGEIVLVYKNLSQDGTVIFPVDSSPKLLVYAGGFEMNFLRTLLIIFFQLALLGAIAITMGAFFSTPVAAFVSIFALLLVFMNTYIHSMAQKRDYSPTPHHHGAPAEQRDNSPNPVDVFVHYVFVSLDTVMAPLKSANALQRCSTGRFVGWDLLGRVFLYRVLIYSGVLAAIAALGFSRRELALPQR